MSAADAATRVLWDELAPVTPAMVEAGSRALTAASIAYEATPAGRRPVASTHSEAERLSAVYWAMLAAKLGQPA